MYTVYEPMISLIVTKCITLLYLLLIVILCGGYVGGDCDHAFYTNPSVNAPVGKGHLLPLFVTILLL